MPGWIVIGMMALILAVSFFSGYAAGNADGYTQGVKDATFEYEKSAQLILTEIQSALVESNIIANRALQVIRVLEQRLEAIEAIE